MNTPSGPGSWTYQEGPGFGGGPAWRESTTSGLVFRDRTSPTDYTSYFWVYSPIPVCAGHTYCYSFTMQVNNGSSVDAEGSMFIDVGWSTASTTPALDLSWGKSFHTSSSTYYSAPNPGAAFVASGAVPTRATPPSITGNRTVWGWNAVPGATSPLQTMCWTAPRTETAYLKFRWTGDQCATCGDDTQISSVSFTCRRNV